MLRTNQLHFLRVVAQINYTFCRSTLSRATNFGSGEIHSEGLHSAGLHSGGLHSTSLRSGSLHFLGPPILDLEIHMTVRKNTCRGPFNANVVDGSTIWFYYYGEVTMHFLFGSESFRPPSPTYFIISVGLCKTCAQRFTEEHKLQILSYTIAHQIAMFFA